MPARGGTQLKVSRWRAKKSAAACRVPPHAGPVAARIGSGERSAIRASSSLGALLQMVV